MVPYHPKRRQRGIGYHRQRPAKLARRVPEKVFKHTPGEAVRAENQNDRIAVIGIPAQMVSIWPKKTGTRETQGEHILSPGEKLYLRLLGGTRVNHLTKMKVSKTNGD